MRFPAPCLQGRGPREWAQKSLHGVLREVPRKLVEPMGLAPPGASAQAVRTMPGCISEGAWEAAAIVQPPWQDVDQTWREAAGVLTGDGRDFLHQGQALVGVKRPSCGEGASGPAVKRACAWARPAARAIPWWIAA